jgi:hypothetical protein
VGEQVAADRRVAAGDHRRDACGRDHDHHEIGEQPPAEA